MKQKIQNKYKLINISDLIPYARNARTHSEKQIKQIASSIKEFGFINPVIIDKDNCIIAGHGRVLAAEKLKLKEVPSLRIEHLTEIQKKAYILADNKLALNAGWDESVLQLELEELKDLNFDFDIIGFDDYQVEEFTPNIKEESNSVDVDNFKVIVTLENEDEQQLLFNELKDRGLKVKI